MAYPSEGAHLLYSFLLLTQVIIAFLVATGRLCRVSRIVATFERLTLVCYFTWIMLGTLQPPVLDLIQYRWLLRGSWGAYAVLSLYIIIVEYGYRCWWQGRKHG